MGVRHPRRNALRGPTRGTRHSPGRRRPVLSCLQTAARRTSWIRFCGSYFSTRAGWSGLLPVSP